MRCDEDNVASESYYPLETPLSPIHGVSIWENTQIVSAPIDLLAPSAMLEGWTQVGRLAHDFFVGEYAIMLPIATMFLFGAVAR